MDPYGPIWAQDGSVWAHMGQGPGPRALAARFWGGRGGVRGAAVFLLAAAAVWRASVNRSVDSVSFAGDFLVPDPFSAVGEFLAPLPVADARPGAHDEAVAAFQRLKSNAETGVGGRAEFSVSFGAPGTVKWRHLTVSPVAGGGALWRAEDNTASREVDSVRRAEETSLAVFLDLLPVGFFSADGKGRILFANGMTPGWAHRGELADPRQRQLGSLPRNWARYRGLYRHGNQVVLSYTVGETGVLETPWAGQADGRLFLTRTLEFDQVAKQIGRASCRERV